MSTLVDLSLVMQTLDAYRDRATSYSNPARSQSHQRAEKLLRAMMDHAPTQEGQEQVGHAITLCISDDEKLLCLADYYFTGLIRPMKALGGQTPLVSDYPSRRSEETQREINTQLVESAKRDRGALKTLTLHRDGHRCALSGSYDRDSACNGIRLPPAGSRIEATEAAHIIPFALTKDKNNNDVNNFAAVWKLITMFTGISLSELNGDMINRPENIITLTLDAHWTFGRLETWLEPIDGQPNKYRFNKFHPFASNVPYGTIIALESADPGIPLPDARYLGLHAACAKIAHASGAAEVIDQYMRDMADMKVLSQDGSSMGTLEHALSLARIAAR